MVNKLKFLIALLIPSFVYSATLQPEARSPMTITVPQNGNVVGITINQNDTNNNPNALTTNGAVTVKSLTCTGSPCGTGSGGAGANLTNPANQNDITYYSAPGSSNTLSGSDNLTWNGSVLAATGQLSVNQTLNGSVNAATIISTGTGIPLLITPQGLVSNGYQNKKGALTVGDDVSSRNFSTLAVLVDSTTDSQLGGGLLEVWEDNPNHNDPGIWYHDKSNGSGGQIRIDATGGNGPNFEITGSSDTAHGMSKWEPFAEAGNGGLDLQINNRSYDNTGFETIGYWHPLQKTDILPGLYINPQNSSADGAIVTSSGTSGVTFFTLNSHTVGLTAPPNSTVSWTNAMPDTIGAAGNLMYHGGTVANGLFTDRQWKWSGSDAIYSATTGLTVSTVTASSATFTNMTISGTCIGCGSGVTVYPATATASFPFGLSASTMVLTSTGNVSVTENGITGQVVLSTAGVGVTAGHCAQFGSSMTIVDAGAACGTGSGGGGSGSGTVNVSPQYQVPFYSVTGSSNVLSSSANFTNNGSTITMINIQTFSETNVTTQTASGVLFNYTGSSITVSSATATLLYATTSTVNGVNSGQLIATDKSWFSPNINFSTDGDFLNFVKLSPSDTISSYRIAASTGDPTDAMAVPEIYLAPISGGTPIIWTGIFTGGGNVMSTGTAISNSGVTIRGALAVNSGSGISGQVLTSAGSASAPTWTTPVLLSSTQTFSGINTFTSSVTVNAAVLISTPGTSVTIGGGLTFSSTPIKMDAYTAQAYDGVILASSNFNNRGSTITLPSASGNPGQQLTIWQVNNSTASVFIKAAGSDLVIGTNTVTLCATGQGGTLMSSGQGNWFMYGKFNDCPKFLTDYQLVGAPAALTASSDTVAIPIIIDRPVMLCGFRAKFGATGSANMNMGLWDSNLNLIVSSGPIVVPGTSMTNYLFLTPQFLPPGLYWRGIQASNTTATLTGITTVGIGMGCYRQTGAALTLPNPLSNSTAGVSCPYVGLVLCGGITQ